MQNEDIKKLEDLLDADSLTPETSLDSLQWDSMAMLGVIAWARTRGKKVSGDMIKQMKTVADILAVV